MLQSFTGILENGQIQWEEPQQLPKHAKVIVTVLEEIQNPEPKTNKLARFDGIWKDLPKEKKKSLDEHIKDIRNKLGLTELLI